MHRLGLAVAACLLLALPRVALAWGPLAHEAVWIAARGMLGPDAARAVEALLPPGAGPGLSWWADIYRGTPEGEDTARWHYVNIPLTAAGFDRKRDCAARPADRALPGGACVVAAIEAMAERVADPALARPVRYQALAFLVHFVADLHQPLHATTNGDRGGNDVWVRQGGRTLRLHALWDTPVVRFIDPDSAALAWRIAAAAPQDPAQRRAMAAGTPAAWAEESRDVARDAIYLKLGGGRLPPPGGNTEATPWVLPRDYVEAQREVVMLQLVRAAVRLAGALDARF